MKIVELSAENVKRLRAVQIRPDGALVVIGGNNAQGKSSVLDAIAMALAGKGSQGLVPVRQGEGKARVVLNLDDLVVTRTITSTGGGTLKVQSKDGVAYPSPQAMLDKLASKLSFDPLAFARENPKRQAELLKDLVGIDFDGVDRHRTELYNQRTEINRRGKEKAAKLEGMQHFDGADEVVSVTDLLVSLRASEAHNDRNRELRAQAEDVRQGVEEWREEVQDLERKLQEARNRLDVCQEQYVGAIKSIENAPANIDLEPIREQIATAGEHNERVKANRERAALMDEVNKLRNDSLALTARIESLDAMKADDMASASFPVEGLGFNEHGVTFNGLPFESCSSAEQLRVSVAMGIAMNPKLRVLLIRDGSLLDEDSLRMVAEMATEHDAQVWVERVGKGQECSVIIEDGAISS
jgi:energy-coupling factor transporter ATP-binding protein EcfA2